MPPTKHPNEPPTEPLTNEHGQPIGDPLPDGWRAPPAPSPVALEGRVVRVEPLQPERHGDDLVRANELDSTGVTWTYMASGPFAGRNGFTNWIDQAAATDDPLYFAFVDRVTKRAIGCGSYMRIKPAAASIEVGGIWFSPALQRTTAATEVMHLMMAHAFELGYRRYEWKCDALNAPSRRAAERLGFTYEGIFRKALVYKGRNRDTAWYAITDDDWPVIRAAHQAWLAPENFDGKDRQRRSLADMLREARPA